MDTANDFQGVHMLSVLLLQHLHNKEWNLYIRQIEAASIFMSDENKMRWVGKAHKNQIATNDIYKSISIPTNSAEEYS